MEGNANLLDISNNPKLLKPNELKEKIDKYVEDEIVPNLEEFVRIPNLSRNFDKDHLTNGLHQKACTFCMDWANKQGIKNLTLEMVELEGRTPVVYGEIPASPGINTSLLMYGHIDKQPHLNDAWDEGLHPTEPVRRGDLIYGWGVSDDGYAPFACVTIVKFLQEQNLPHPRIVWFWECDEESGSVDIGFWIDHLKDRIGHINMIFCLDSGCFDYDHWYITSTLRGCCNFELTVEVLNSGVHSGSAGGVVPDTFRIIRQLISRLQDEKTGRVVEELHRQIPGKVYSDSEKVVNLIGDSFVKAYDWIDGVKPMHQNTLENYLNRALRPTCTMIGIEGLPNCENAGNVIRPKTKCTVSMRMSPFMEVEEAKKTITSILMKDLPYNCKVNVDWKMVGNGFFSPVYPAHIEELMIESSKEAFNNNGIMFNHEGGSIPFMNLLLKKFPDSYFVVTGLLGPNTNAHAGNENISVSMLKKLLHCLTRFCEKVATAKMGDCDNSRTRFKSHK